MERSLRNNQKQIRIKNSSAEYIEYIQKTHKLPTQTAALELIIREHQSRGAQDTQAENVAKQVASSIQEMLHNDLVANRLSSRETEKSVHILLDMVNSVISAMQIKEPALTDTAPSMPYLVSKDSTERKLKLYRERSRAAKAAKAEKKQKAAPSRPEQREKPVKESPKPQSAANPASDSDDFDCFEGLI